MALYIGALSALSSGVPTEVADGNYARQAINVIQIGRNTYSIPTTACFPAFAGVVNIAGHALYDAATGGSLLAAWSIDNSSVVPAGGVHVADTATVQITVADRITVNPGTEETIWEVKNVNGRLARKLAASMTDDAKFNLLFALLSAIGGGSIIASGNNFTITNTIKPASNVQLQGLGYGVTTFTAAANLNDNVFNLSLVSNCVLRNLTVNGNYANQFGTYTVAAPGASSSTTIPLTSTAGIASGQTLYIYSGTGTVASKPSITAVGPNSITVSVAQTLTAGQTIVICSGDDNAANGIRFDGCTNCGLEDVEVTGAWAHGVFWNNTHGNSDGCFATRVWVHGNGQIGFHVHSDDSGTYYSHNYSINQVWCYANSVVASVPYISGAGRQYGGFYATYHGDRWVTISNIMVWNERGPGLQIKGRPVSDAQVVAQDIVMTNITVSNCGTDGTTGGLNANVYIGNEAGSITINNLVSTGANGDGVAFVSGALAMGPVFLNGGHVRGNAGNGINLAAANSTTAGIRIAGMEISGNTGRGILFGGSNLSDVEITNCTIAGNTSFGLNCAGVTRIKVRGNTFSLNAGGGVRFSSSSSNILIEGNTFIDNCASSSGAQRNVDLSAASAVSIKHNTHVVSARTNTGNAIFCDATTTAVTVDGEIFSGLTANAVRFNGSVATAATRSLVTNCRLTGTAAYVIQADANTVFVGTQSNFGGATATVLDNSGGASVTQNFTGA